MKKTKVNGCSLMQYLKDDVKNSILQAALSEFKRHGYSNASMRQIANSAGITTGNIYRYFKNKEDLFHELIHPVYEKFVQYMIEIKDDLDDNCAIDTNNPLDYLRKVESTIVELFKESNVELRILLNLSNGSSYEPVKQELIQLAALILEQVFIPGGDQQDKAMIEKYNLAHMLAGTLIEGACIILRDHEDGETVRQLVDELMRVYCAGIISRLKI
ncbi:TetR/AcrR family transcriptional regulator [Paenibacillus segetis]|uniref:TetR family transcriptional regulator n=1 Tax=Paenibacillus segetis TaxID=1325360 RepID=A0ABQ1YDK5_9BACL|nr:TetR/AcrR family transcriptional regulator [Paenibacillus segetis]GGH21463.1 TetR family transcriptional regulator [Paenibacillus segetis]